MGCLANAKGMLVTSSKSVTTLGLTAGDACPLPLRPAGVVGPAIAKGAGAGAPAPLADMAACSALSKK